jgi:small subunit ribosomal protein S4
MKGVTGENLLMLLESRLDNTIFRLGLTVSRDQARQMILHRHFLVNDHIVNIPSYTLKPGDTIQVKSKSRKLSAIHESLKKIQGDSMYPWLTLDKAKLTGTFVDRPQRVDIPVNIQENMIVELYSK